MSDFQITPLDRETDFNQLTSWDVIIIGAGPAGLAAALTTAHRGLTTLVLEAQATPGGQPQFLYPDKRIVDVPGFPDGMTGEEHSARVYRQAVNALVRFRFNEVLLDIHDTEQTAKDDALKQIGYLSAADIFHRLQLRMNGAGSAAVDAYYETSRKGIFAVGDVPGDIKLITVAWAEGIQAAIYAFKEITSPFWLNERRRRDLKISLIGRPARRGGAGSEIIVP